MLNPSAMSVDASYGASLRPVADSPFFLGLLILFASIEPAAASLQFEEKALDSRLTVVFGGGGNSGILVTDSAVFVIDTKLGSTRGFAELVRSKAGTKPIVIMNTHFHPDHVGGNPHFAGSRVIAGSYDQASWIRRNGRNDLPTEWITDSLVLHAGDETITLRNVGAAHTFDDVIVWLHKRRILFMGDLVFAGRHPVLDTAGGCDPLRWTHVLDMLRNDYAALRVVPGHGDIGPPQLLRTQHDYFADMADAARDPGNAEAIRAKYSSYAEIQNLASFDRNLAIIKDLIGRKEIR